MCSYGNLLKCIKNIHYKVKQNKRNIRLKTGIMSFTHDTSDVIHKPCSQSPREKTFYKGILNNSRWTHLGPYCTNTSLMKQRNSRDFLVHSTN